MSASDIPTRVVIKTAPWVYGFVQSYHQMASANGFPFDFDAMRTIAGLAMTTNIRGFVPPILRMRKSS